MEGSGTFLVPYCLDLRSYVPYMGQMVQIFSTVVSKSIYPNVLMFFIGFLTLLF